MTQKVFGQNTVVLHRTVTSPAGDTQQLGDTSFAFTVGESIIGTTGNGSGFITQGFQQPFDKAPIRFSKAVVKETCPGINDGSIILGSFTGCPVQIYDVMWASGAVGPAVYGLASGWHAFTINSCEEIIIDSAFVGLIYEDPCQLTFYTAFSPNGDGVNDVWEIDNVDVLPNSNNTLEIINVWGQVVRTFDNYDNTTMAWDGNDRNGNKLAEGTYYFVLTLSFKTYSGYIELTR